jgi:hypothetical protein
MLKMVIVEPTAVRRRLMTGWHPTTESTESFECTG